VFSNLCVVVVLLVLPVGAAGAVTVLRRWRRDDDWAGRGVVVVGATSGVGRAVAELFAAMGTRLVLASRDSDELANVSRDCLARGARSVATCVVDNACAADVDRLGEVARHELDVVDVWVELAAVLVAGDLVACPADDLERIVATNVLGSMLGARAALRLFDAQGRGTLINVSSLLGLVPNPLVPAYCATKFAVRGLTLALQQSPRPRSIRVCLVVPGPIDTPMFARAGNHTGRQLRSIPPAASPWRVAATVVRCARRPRRTTTTGVTGWGLLLAHRVAPRPTEWGVATYSAALLTRRAAQRSGSGALFGADAPGSVDGGWRRGRLRRQVGDRFGRWWATQGTGSTP